MKYSIVPATQEHVDLMHPHLRVEDTVEMWYQAAVKPEEGLRFSLETSQECYSVFLEGSEIPCLMFGMSKAMSLMDTARCIWLLGTPEAAKVKKTFVLESSNVIAAMAAGHVVYNYVSADHVQSLRWLKWLGFHIMEAKPYGWLKKPFHYVEREYPCASSPPPHS